MLTPSKASFYGIVPENLSTPIGSVTLPVTFGTKLTTSGDPKLDDPSLETNHLGGISRWAWQLNTDRLSFHLCELR